MMRAKLNFAFLSFIGFLLKVLSSSSLSSSTISGNTFREEAEKGNVEIVGRYQFPNGFLFGVGTSAYQVEGAILEDGKSLSNWDAFVHIKGAISNGDTGDIADDSYHRYLEDNEIMHSLGVDAYRFSISWSRILPIIASIPFGNYYTYLDLEGGKFGSVNLAGITFYNRVIDDLLIKGIQPFVTIHHNDIPKELDDRYGGWLSPLMQDDYAHFAKTCFKNFGDRVKYWVTINEPNLASEMAYMRGQFAPGHCSPPFGNCSTGNSDIEPLIATHNMLLAHAKAAKLYRDQFKSEQDGIIGIVAHAFMFEPLTDDEHDRDATDRALAFNIGWTFDPLVYGDYPPEMRRYHGNELRKFTFEETKLLKDSIDFIGINHYATLYVKDCLCSNCNCLNVPGCVPGGDRAIKGFLLTIPQRNGIPIGEPTGNDRFCVVPRGIEGIVNYVKIRYHNRPMIITENGYSSPIKQDQLDLQNDVKRVEYHKQYLAFLARAIRNGADVRGYFVWSLMDNFEWSSGFSVKYGLYGIDGVTLNRLPRFSAKWYRDFLKNNNPNATQYKTFIFSKDKYGSIIHQRPDVRSYKDTTNIFNK